MRTNAICNYPVEAASLLAGIGIYGLMRRYSGVSWITAAEVSCVPLGIALARCFALCMVGLIAGGPNQENHDQLCSLTSKLDGQVENAMKAPSEDPVVWCCLNERQSEVTVTTKIRAKSIELFTITVDHFEALSSTELKAKIMANMILAQAREL